MLGTEINPPGKQNSCLTIKPSFQPQERLILACVFRTELANSTVQNTMRHSIMVEIGCLSHSSWEAEMEQTGKKPEQDTPFKDLSLWLTFSPAIHYKFNHNFIFPDPPHPLEAWTSELLTNNICHCVILLDPHYNSGGISTLDRWKKKATFREICLRSYCSNRPRIQVSFSIKVRWLKKLKNILQKTMKLITLER